jgi:hypothetical protein
MPPLNRRDFMVASGSLGIASTVAGTAVAAPTAVSPANPATGAAAFYDARLPDARAALLRHAGQPGQPLAADLTEALRQVQAARQQRPTVPVHGVSGEALPFCLQGLLPGATLSLQRLDSDHFAWTLA